MRATTRLSLAAWLACLAAAPAAAGQFSWSSAPAARTDGPSLIALSCRALTLCVAVDRDGAVLRRHSALAGRWVSLGSAGAAQRLDAVSCPSHGLCFAASELGRLYYGSPSAHLARWSAETIDPVAGLAALQCPSRRLCVAVDRLGRLTLSTAPRDALRWSLPMPLDGSLRVAGIACPSASLCVAVADGGRVLLSRRPAEVSSWHVVASTGSQDLQDVACTPAGLCLATSADGLVYASGDIGAQPVTWSATDVDAPRSLVAASCADRGICVLLDDRGRLLESDAPTSGSPAWRVVATDPAGAPGSALACLTAGACVVGDVRGDTLTATLPPPSVRTVAGAGLTPTNAALEASVDVGDATPSGCRFDYGPTTSYGAAVPCVPQPAPGRGGQTVRAQLAGLRPGATYHFRVVAASAVGTTIGRDGVVATPALAPPRPTLTGTPAAGGTLTCHPGVAVTAPAVVTFAWLRDQSPIAGATAARYAPGVADETHHVSCVVTVAENGASASASSGFASIPPELVETSVGAPRPQGAAVAIPVRCSPQAAGRCTITLVLSVSAATAARATVGSAVGLVTAGASRTLDVSLDQAGRRLLRRRRSLPVTLAVNGTIFGVLAGPLGDATLLLRAGTPPQRRNGGTSMSSSRISPERSAGRS